MRNTLQGDLERLKDACLNLIRDSFIEPILKPTLTFLIDLLSWRPNQRKSS